jgi:hypothetical protein
MATLQIGPQTHQLGKEFLLSQVNKLHKMNKYLSVLLLILVIGCTNSVEKTPLYSIQCDSIQHFYRGDTLIASIQIANGKFNGFATSFVENAGFKTEAFYNNGKLHGDLRVFSSEGNLVQTGQYCMGYKCGKWLDFHEDGTLKRLQLYSIDERSQLIAEWDSQSKMKNLRFNIKILRFGSDSIFIQRERLPELQVFINDGERAREIFDYQDLIPCSSNIDTVQGYLMHNGIKMIWKRRVLNINKFQDRLNFLWAD